MLKKSIKKFIALALATVTVATGSTAVSASTLTPKKSHKDSEVQSRVLYLIDAADDIAFSPYSGFAGDVDGGNNGASFDSRHNRHSYRAYAMCDLLLATPNLTSACSPETVAELKKARKTWKAAYVSDMMYTFYYQIWCNTEYIVSTKYAPEVTYKNPRLFNGDIKGNVILHRGNPDKALKKATSSYNRVKAYIAKYQSYNPTLASKLTQWNNIQYKTYKKIIGKFKTINEDWFVEAANKCACGGGDIFILVQDYYKIHAITGCEVNEEWKLSTKIGNWYWGTKGMSPFNPSPNAPLAVFMRNTSYTKW